MPLNAEIETFVYRARQARPGLEDLETAANDLVARQTPSNSLIIARRMYELADPAARVLATLVLGRRAADYSVSQHFLRTRVSRDRDPRVQVALGRAFDQLCHDLGYGQALPTIEAWLGSPNPNVRLAVINGLHVWTKRPFFDQNPERAAALLGGLRADPSLAVRRAVAVALREISRKHRAAVRAEMQTWDRRDRVAAQTYTWVVDGLE